MGSGERPKKGNKKVSFYTGNKGAEYYEMREARRSDFVQERRASHFQPFIKETDTVLDFGCGTGGVLGRINCAKKIGIEVNAPSIKEAEEQGIKVFDDISKVKDQSIDIAISNHALEHVPNPADQITQIARTLKPGGKAILVVPAENPASIRFSKWVKDDPDQHIYSWTPLSFGNLINQCGLEIERCYRRPIGYSKFIEPVAEMNEQAFQVARRGVAFLLDRYEVACIAKKS